MEITSDFDGDLEAMLLVKAAGAEVGNVDSGEDKEVEVCIGKCQ